MLYKAREKQVNRHIEKADAKWAFSGEMTLDLC
jgi:hypothetical protein